MFKIDSKVVILCLFLSACSTPSKQSSKDGATGDASPSEYETLCSKGSKEACFVQAMREDQVGQKEKSKEFLLKACAIGHAHSCTQIGIDLVMEKKDFERGIQFSKKGCDELDSTGCYNVACFSCQKNDKTSALKFLARAIELGFDQPKLLQEDPDLECLRKDKVLTGIIENLKSKKNQVPTTPFHQPFHSLGIAMTVPSGFEATMPFPATLKDSSGSWIRITTAPIPVQYRIDSLKKYKLSMGKETEEGAGETNSAPYYWLKFDIKSAGSVAMIFVMGNDKRSVRIESFVPKMLAADFGNLIFSSVRSTVFDPRADFSQPIVDFDLGKGFLGLKQVGPVETAVEFTGNGKAVEETPEGLYEVVPAIRVYPIRAYEQGIDDNFERMTAADLVHESLPKLDDVAGFTVGKTRNVDDKEFYITEAEAKYNLTGRKGDIELYAYMVVLKGKPAVAFVSSWAGPLPKGGKQAIINGLKNWARMIKKQMKRAAK